MPRRPADAGRAAAIQSVVDRYVAALNENAPADAAALCAGFPDLMPDLAEALQTARILHAAHRAAADEHSSAQGGESSSVADDWRFPPTRTRTGTGLSLPRG